MIETAARLCPPNLCDGQLVDHPAPQDDSEPEPPSPPSPPEGLWALLDDAAGTYQTLVSPDPEAVSSVDALQQEARVVTTTTPPPTTRPTQGPSTDDAVDDAAAGEAPAFAPAGLAGIPVLELDAVGQLVDSIEPGEDPTLHYLHLLLPHAPYHFLPSGQTYDPDATLAGGISEISGTRSTEQRGADVDRQRLVLQAMYVDRVVGDVLDRLQETGLAEDTLVVVVADHGVGLQPGATPRPTTPENMTEDAYPDMLPVPMLLRGPGIQPGAVNDDNVETIDVVPTLADLLGIDIPWPVDGIAVTTERRPDDEKRFHLVSFDGGMIGPTTVGPATPYDGAEVFAEALDRTVDSLFRTDNPDHRVYDLDEAGELVGARVDGLTSRSSSRVSVVLDDPDALADVDPPSGVLRTHLVGRVEGLPDGDQVTVAVALNGRVAAVVTTWPEGGSPTSWRRCSCPTSSGPVRTSSPSTGSVAVKGRAPSRPSTAQAECPSGPAGSVIRYRFRLPAGDVRFVYRREGGGVCTRRRFGYVAVAVVLVVGCTAGDDGAEEAGSGTATTTAESTPSATGPSPGVTDDAVKIGVVYVDTEALTSVGLNYDLGDYEAVYQALFDDLNVDGGINGRQVEPVFAPVDPPPFSPRRRPASSSPRTPTSSWSSASS